MLRPWIAAMAIVGALLAVPAVARDTGWHAVEVPGGRATLARLGMPEHRERSAVMIDLIRRLHFSTSATPSPSCARNWRINTWWVTNRPTRSATVPGASWN